MKKILTVGDLFLDIIPSAFPVEKEKILHDGESFVDNVVFQRGGCAGNFVAVMKNVFEDYSVGFITKTGDDYNGTFLVKQMESYGVKPMFAVGKGESTAITIAVSFKDGERHFITQLGALDTFSSMDIDYSLFKDCDHVAYRGIWFAKSLLNEAESLMKAAKEAGASTSMDLGFDPFWALNHPDVPKRKTSALNALKHVDYVFGNQKEFKSLTNSETMEQAIEILKKNGANIIVIHMGSKGARIIKGDETIDIPVTKVEIKNPVGSGDTFDSVFIGSILAGKSLEDAGKLAGAVAALSISSQPGTKLSKDAIQDFISKNTK